MLTAIEQRNPIDTALSEFHARQSRDTHPSGYFDDKGRWYPSDEETQPCCEDIRTPTRRFPYSLMVHCRTLRHVAQLHDVDEGTLRQAVRDAREPTPRKPVVKHRAYKAVTSTREPGVYRSCYDAETLYQFGKTVCQKVQPEHGGGYYVYRTAEEARLAEFPTGVIEPTHIMLCEVWGRSIDYGNGKTAWTYLKPISAVWIDWLLAPDTRFEKEHPIWEYLPEHQRRHYI